MSETATLHETIFSCTSKDEKKDLLVSLSNDIKIGMEMGEIDSENVNSALIEMFQNKEHQTFETFHNWKKKGYKVKKGSKAFFIWSKPLKSKKKEEAEKEKKVKEDEKKSYKFFGMAYLFSNSQVEKSNS
jgi:hypothetical protein